MPLYKEEYLEKHFDDFNFFDPQCRDGRTREINMRTKRCLSCPGFHLEIEEPSRPEGRPMGIDCCQRHPDYWLKGADLRRVENEQL